MTTPAQTFVPTQMSTPLQTIEEMLSFSYVSAVIAQAGATWDSPKRDFGIDVSVRRIEKYDDMIIDSGVLLDCQLKATIDWSETPDEIIYDLDAKAYNKLVIQSSRMCYKCILIVFCLPTNKGEWLRLTEDELKLRRCCYYTFITGERTDHTRSVRIKIPKENILSPEAIKSLIGIGA